MTEGICQCENAMMKIDFDYVSLERLRENLDETVRINEQLDTKWRGQIIFLQERITYLEDQLRKANEEDKNAHKDCNKPLSTDQYELIRKSADLEM